MGENETTGAHDAPILRVCGISKRFGGTLALDHVDLDVRRGEVHALLGQNGAGKSTLIKVLAGIHSVDDGEAVFAGETLKSGADRTEFGFVHQDLGLVNELTVAENIALVAGFSTRGPLISWRRTLRLAQEVLSLVGSPLDSERPVSSLNVGERAIVAIARALARNDARLLILDEPTARLHQPDVVRLFAALAALRERGVGLLYVTHRLDEVFRIADRVSVLRDGRLVATTPVSDTTPHELVELIVGHTSSEVESLSQPRRGDVILSFRDVVVGRVGPVSGDVREGECVALVGLQGGGQEAIGRALFGVLRIESGDVVYRSERFAPRNPAFAIRRGLAFVSGDRAEESIVPEMAVRENLFLSPPTHPAFRPIWRGAERNRARAALERFDVRPRTSEAVIHTLSGGNQQKVVLARWLTQACSLLLLEEPTAGVDVEAKQAIYHLIREFQHGGGAAILVSADLDEVLELADRALVFDRGRLVDELSNSELTEQSLTLAIAGAGTSSAGATAKTRGRHDG